MNSIKKIFEDFTATRDKIEISVDEIKKELAKYKGKIVLYGAGSAGIAFLNYLRDAEIEPMCFADGDIEKQGKRCEGLEIISSQQIIKNFGVDTLVIVTINTDGKSYCKDFKEALLRGGHEGVHQRLREIGLQNIIDYTYFRKCFKLFSGEKYNLPSCSDIELMLKNRNEIMKVYNLLEDQLSKETFEKIVEFRLLNNLVIIPTIDEAKMYFEYKLFPKNENEVFIDCGACGGSSLKVFLEENNKEFKHYYGIEPDFFNFMILKKYIGVLPEDLRLKCTLYNKAVFNQNKEAKFYILNGPGSFAAENGPDKMPTIIIDEIAKTTGATYIKMNIEGSEVQALQGGKNVISNYKPRLAIMGYHKTSDLWNIPLLIKEMNPSYKIALRSYMHNIAFAYYAF